MPSPEAFHAAMIDLYHVVKRECSGYVPSYFSQMVSDHGGLAAAKTLLHASQVSSGFTRLWELHRLDLTVEAFILQDQWRPLFSEEEVAIAKSRLQEYGYAT